MQSASDFQVYGADDQSAIYGSSFFAWNKEVPVATYYEGFLCKLYGAACLDGFRIWCEIVELLRDIPVQDRSRLGRVAHLAPQMHIFERAGGSIDLQARYFGKEIVERLGRDLTGQKVHTLLGRNPEAVWRLYRPVFEEARPMFLVRDFAPLGKSWLKVAVLNIPVRGPTGGITRCVGVHHYLPNSHCID